MDFNSIISQYNNSNLKLSNLFNIIGEELEQNFHPACLEYFSKYIIKNNEIVKPISTNCIDGVISFYCGNKKLFQIEKKLYDKMNSNNSALRSSLYPFDQDDGSTYEIKSNNFILGTNGLYEFDKNNKNKYKYITFNGNKIYYEAFIDKERGTIKKNYFDKNGDISSSYFYTFKSKNKIDENTISALNKIIKFLHDEFPKLHSYEYNRALADLMDQYYYDCTLIDKKDKYKDLHIINNSYAVIDNAEEGLITGLSIKGVNNHNKEEYLAISHPTNKDTKLLCVTDFVNGSKVEQYLTKYITLDMKSWFNHLNANELSNENKLILSLGNKILEINRFINEELSSINKNVNIGSTLGLALITKDNTYFLNYGDTRAYVVKDSNFFSLTRNNTIVWNLFKNREMCASEIRNYKRGSLSKNYVGSIENYHYFPEVYKIINNDYDQLYIFSDGVTDSLSDKTMSIILDVNKDSESLREITMQAYKNLKTSDDVTGCCYIKRKK